MSTNTLPEEEQQLLQKLRADNNLPLLRARVALLREAGWTLASIGAPLDANRSTTRMWEYASAKSDFPEAKALREVPEIERPPKGAKVLRKYPDVPVDEREHLRDLADKARTVRGWTPDDDPSRKAADELGELLINYREMGVPLTRLADHMGVTHRAVAARIERSTEKKKEAAA